MMPLDLSVSVLGSVVVQIDGQGNLLLTRSERQLVATLAAAGTEGLSSDALANRLWPKQLPKTWTSSLRNLVSRINRKSLDHNGSRLVTEPQNGRRSLAVPPENVDLWRLMKVAETGALEFDDLGLLSGDPFDDCELEDALRDAAADVWRMRCNLVIHGLDQIEVPPNRYSDLVAIGREFPNDTQLIDAIELIVDQKLRDRGALDKVVLATPVASSQRRSQKIANLCKRPLLRQESEIDDLAVRLVRKETPGLLLFGDRGIGKTALAAEVAARLEKHGFHSAYVIAMGDSVHPSEPFRAFITGIQGLRSAIGAGDTADASKLGPARNGILDYLERTYSGRPLCLVVDNAQWLDGPSQELLRTIAAADLDLEVSIIAVGNLDLEDSLWPSWQSDLEQVWLEPVEVAPLDLQAIERLVASKFPAMEDVTALQLAGRILRSSSGIPLVAAKLADVVDEKSLDFEPAGHTALGFANMITDMDYDLVEIGGIAAALSSEVEVDQVATASGFDPDRVRSAMLSLADDGFLEAQPQPDKFSFPHVLMAEAFADRLEMPRRVEVHRAAFNAATDLPTRTHHAVRLRELGQGLEATEFARLLAAYGSTLETKGEYFRAVKALDHALTASKEDVTLHERVAHANACARVGVPVTDALWELVHELIKAEEFDLAASAAAVGLPEMEKLWGDEERVEIFRLIDPTMLSRESRIRWSIQLSRQLFLLGDRQGATQLADQAFALAQTPDERADGWLAKCRASGWTLLEPEADPEWFTNTSPSRVATIQQAITISDLSGGKSKSRYSEILRQRAYADANGLTTLSFYAKTSQATSLTDIGQFDQASTVATESMQDARRDGLSVAVGVFQTQQFMWRFHQRRHGEVWHRVREAPAEGLNIMYQIVASAARYAHHLTQPKRRREAVADALMVCQAAKETQYATAAAAILAPQIYESGRHEILDWARDVILPFENHYLLFASAVANLGPGQAILAELEAPGLRKTDLLQAAVEQADRDALPLWQVACRTDLAGAIDTEGTGERWLEEAGIHASNPWLQQVLESRRVFNQRRTYPDQPLPT